MTLGERGQLPCEVGCARVSCGGGRTGGTTNTERREAIQSLSAVTAGSGVHICLRAKTTAEVNAFHAAALAAGGASDGAPGIRPHDRVRYYAAFILDPDGNGIEAVTFPQE